MYLLIVPDLLGRFSLFTYKQPDSCRRRGTGNTILAVNARVNEAVADDSHSCVVLNPLSKHLDHAARHELRCDR